MGRLTQAFYYLTRKPGDYSMDIESTYTHLEITPELKKLRKELKWYKK